MESSNIGFNSDFDTSLFSLSNASISSFVMPAGAEGPRGPGDLVGLQVLSYLVPHENQSGMEGRLWCKNPGWTDHEG